VDIDEGFEGRVKAARETVACETRHDVVTKFKVG